MKFDDYQREIEKYDLVLRDEKLELANDPAFLEKAFGLAGESGEVAEKLKKIIRDKQGKITDVEREELKKELGDVIWYVASLARLMEMKFSEVAQGNINKLESRLKRDKLHGSGDNR